MLTLDQSIIPKNGGTSHATVTRHSNELIEAFTIALRSSQTSEATVTILTNETAASFVLKAVDEAVVDLVQTSEILATALGFTQASTTVHVIDDDEPSIWRTPLNPFDVDGNTNLDPFDVFVVIDRVGLLPNTPLDPPIFYDVNGDWQATPRDVLHVINAYNRIGTNAEGEALVASNLSTAAPFYGNLMLSKVEESSISGRRLRSKSRPIRS